MYFCRRYEKRDRGGEAAAWPVRGLAEVQGVRGVQPLRPRHQPGGLCGGVGGAAGGGPGHRLTLLRPSVGLQAPGEGQSELYNGGGVNRHLGFVFNFFFRADDPVKFPSGCLVRYVKDDLGTNCYKNGR